jgi:hypothetical protein
MSKKRVSFDSISRSASGTTFPLADIHHNEYYKSSTIRKLTPEEVKSITYESNLAWNDLKDKSKSSIVNFIIKNYSLFSNLIGISRSRKNCFGKGGGKNKMKGGELNFEIENLLEKNPDLIDNLINSVNNNECSSSSDIDDINKLGEILENNINTGTGGRKTRRNKRKSRKSRRKSRKSRKSRK